MSERIDRVRVTNRNDFTIRDRVDGVPYTFVPGVGVDVPPDVAYHLFAYPGEPEYMHAHMARRWGWNRPEHAKMDENGDTVWQRFARNVVIEVQHYELRPVDHDPDAIPADSAEDAPEMLPDVHARSERPQPQRSGRGHRGRPVKRAKRRPQPRSRITPVVTAPQSLHLTDTVTTGARDADASETG